VADKNETDDAQAREDEAEAVAQQQADALRAESRRERSARGAKQRGDAEAPSQVAEGNKTAYSHERLIRESYAFLDEPSHVVAGALHGVEEPFLTISDARTLVSEFRNREA
jgi:hypothetical protein